MAPEFRELPELVVTLVAEDETDLLVGFKEASFHPRVVKNLGCTFESDRLWERAKKVKWLNHDEDLLTTEGFLNVRGPGVEVICCIW